ncbi:MAG: glycosyltransferase family 2 protein [Anaerolineae bacterium]|nr:glycosyltransferase family 2 protein [Anaerolineae bacterium]
MMLAEQDSYRSCCVPQVAVHIVTYNNAATIEACLQSVQNQSVAVELCIIDNASADNTVSRIQEMGYPVIMNMCNRGYSVAHNQALNCTHAPYILTLNPDVRLEPDFIEQLLAIMTMRPTIGAGAGLLLRTDNLQIDGATVDSGGLYMTAAMRQRLRYEDAEVSTVTDGVRPIFGPDGAAAFYRRAMLTDIALGDEVFDEDFFIHKEDVDICWRMQWRGWESLHVPDARAHHIRHFRPSERATVAAWIRCYALRNRYLLLLKNADTGLLLLNLLPMLLYDSAILLYVLLWEWSSLAAYRDVVVAE